MGTKTGSPGGSRANGVEAAEVVGTILRGMVALQPPCRLRDLEVATGIAAAKLHRYLVSMIATGLIRKSEDGSRYQFGLLAYSLAQAVQNATDFVSSIAPAAASLAQRVGESVGVALWISNSATVVRWFQGSNDLSVVLRPNARLGLTTSTTGSVFGAFLPREVTDQIVRQELASAPNGELTFDGVLRQFAAVRKSGVAVGRGTRVRGINSLSAPIFDRDNRIAACVTILGPEARLDVGDGGEAYREIVEVCNSLSAQLGALR